MVEAKKFNLIIFAPNIKVGGGLVLLKALINQMPQNLNVLYILNESLKNTFKLDTVRFVSSSLLGRIKAEILVKKLSRQSENVFCFHGSPTLFATKCRQSIYIQNALLIEPIIKKSYSINTRVRLWVESALLKLKLHDMACCYVQTITMKKRLIRFCENKNLQVPNILIKPLMPNFNEQYKAESLDKEIDFIYPADHQPHKNLENLFLAWEMLAENGIRPCLVVTLDDNTFQTLKKTIRFEEMRVNILNYGVTNYENMQKLYQKAKVLIFPSLLESFGLPLMEASQMGLEILASDKDFVYDVCNPTDTFDPDSVQSIVSAVKRFKDVKTDTRIPFIKKDFWKTFMIKELVDQ